MFIKSLSILPFRLKWLSVSTNLLTLIVRAGPFVPAVNRLRVTLPLILRSPGIPIITVLFKMTFFGCKRHLFPVWRRFVPINSLLFAWRRHQKFVFLIRGNWFFGRRTRFREVTLRRGRFITFFLLLDDRLAAREWSFMKILTQPFRRVKLLSWGQKPLFMRVSGRLPWLCWTNRRQTWETRRKIRLTVHPRVLYIGRQILVRVINVVPLRCPPRTSA